MLRCVIIGAERTGTNLVRDLLASHPEIFVGGELFNPVLVQRARIPWNLDLKPHLSELNELRRSQPSAFIQTLTDITQEHGYRAIGFKLLYGHGDKDRRVLEYLIREKAVRVVHVKRRNLLRRLLSEERAAKTGVWWVNTSDPPSPPNVRIRLDIQHCVSNFSFIEDKESEYDSYFRGHHKLDLFYEDVSADPQAARMHAIEFLGLPQKGEVRIWSRKTGTDSLRDAIENYDELKAGLSEWRRFFED